MDRSWMYLVQRWSVEFINGVNSFLDFAFEKSSLQNRILCPCRNCKSQLYRTREDVYDHLICAGFQKGYLQWSNHGEGFVGSSSTSTQNEGGKFQHDMHGLLHDIFPGHDEFDMGNNEQEMDDEADVDNQPPTENEGTEKDALLKDLERKVYPNCKYSKLSCFVHLYHLKCLNGWSNKSLSMFLVFIKDLLPQENELPVSSSQVKKVISKLGLGYEKIHACPRGCMLFWGDKENEEVCTECGQCRWKECTNESLEEVVGESLEEAVDEKKKPANILCWFPLKPRLKRLYMSSKTATVMRWHHEGRKKDGKLRHPADAEAWKDFDQKNPVFASEPRNVRLALASDGFNPFRTMNTSYSIWPVFLIPYNLPLSGWSTKGEYACPVCAFDTASQWLHHGRKFCYMCHRRWLPADHEWRLNTLSFDGKEEFRAAPGHLSGEEVLEQLKDIDFLTENSNGGPWKKKSIFFYVALLERFVAST